jgi:outer membrane protein, multidrug efflux system
MNAMKPTHLLIGAFAMLSSCTGPVGPNHREPGIDLPDRWSLAEGTSKGSLAAAWWGSFCDPELNRLQVQAIRANQDLIAAMHRIDEAAATLNIARADILPTITGSDSAQRSQQSANNNQIQGFSPEIVNQYRWGGTLSYELDLWGKVRRGVESKKASFESTLYARDAVMLRLTGEVAEQYFALRAFDAEGALLDDTIQLRKESLAIARTRFEGGLTSESDVTRATSALASAEADSADVTRRRDLISNSLAELCGQPASSFSIARATVLPNRVPEVPLSSPAAMLRQRPDIAEAERTLASRNADIGVAMGERLPSVKFNANLSLESLTLSDLLTKDSRAFNVGPEISVPIFTGGANKSRVKQAEARQAQAASDWRGSVLAAIKEVEDALTNQRGYRYLVEIQQRNAESATKTTALSLERYQKGLVNYLEVFDAQREELLARRSFVQAQGNRLSTSVALMKSLGGGWSGGS